MIYIVGIDMEYRKEYNIIFYHSIINTYIA
jgi:hypothetical protein